MRKHFAPATQATRPRSVAIIGSCGGIGASTLAALLASSHIPRESKEESAKRWLIETKPNGNLEALLGLEQHGGLRWQQLSGTRGAVDTHALAQASPHYAGAHVLIMDRFAAVAPEPLAQDEVMASLIDQQHHLYIDANLDSLMDTSMPVDLLVVLTPFSLLGLNSVVSLHSKLSSTVQKMVVVGSGLRPMTLTARQFEKAAEASVIGWYPKISKVSQQVELGVGPNAARLPKSLRKLLTSIHTAIESAVQ